MSAYSSFYEAFDGVQEEENETPVKQSNRQTNNRKRKNQHLHTAIGGQGQNQKNSGSMKHTVAMNREAGMESIIEEDEQPQQLTTKEKAISNTNFASNISLSKRK